MRPESHQKRTITSWEYIHDNFEPTDRLAVVIKRQQNHELVQRIATAEQVAGSRFQSWLRFENAHGGNVYLSMNPLKPDARGRTKQDVALVRHLYLDIDHNGARVLASVLADPLLPKPSYVLNTSAGKYQVTWKVAGFAAEVGEALQRAMAAAHGADRAVVDVSRVLRIPGFNNHKYDPPYRVTAEKLSDSIYDPADFRIEPQSEWFLGRPSAMGRPQRQPGRCQISQSERDWAETLHRLEHGENPAAVQAWLEQKRQDKHDPAYYAALTVRKAVAELDRRRAACIEAEIS